MRGRLAVCYLIKRNADGKILKFVLEVARVKRSISRLANRKDCIGKGKDQKKRGKAPNIKRTEKYVKRKHGFLPLSQNSAFRNIQKPGARPDILKRRKLIDYFLHVFPKSFLTALTRGAG